MQGSLYNTTLFRTNSSNIPPPTSPIQEPAITSQVDLDMQVLDTPNFSSHGSPLHVINTSFDHKHTFNKTLGFPPTNKKKRYRYTQKERTHVALAKRCTSLEDFQEKVSKFFYYMNFLKRLPARLSLNYPLVRNLMRANISNYRMKI